MAAQRKFTYLLAAGVVVVSLVAAWLEIPLWVTLPVAIGVVFAGMAGWLRYMASRSLAPAENPEVAGRLAAICRQVGAAELQPVVVAGLGLPVLARHGNEIRISPRTSELLTDAELAAMVQELLSVPEGAVRRVRWLAWGPVAAVIGLGVLGTLITRQAGVLGAATGLSAVVAVIWTGLRNRRGPFNAGLVRTILRHFLERGGNPDHLASAQLKVYSELIRAGYHHPTVIAQLRQSLHLLAEMGGLPPERLQEVAAAVAAPEELHRPPRVPIWHRRSPNRLLFRLLCYLGLFILSLIIARAADNG